MKAREHSRGSLFLLEILLNIVLFMILTVVSLHFFMKTRDLTDKTTTLHEAVTLCTNVANIYEYGDGSLTPLTDIYTDATILESKLIIPVDEDYQACSTGDATYRLVVDATDDPATRVDTVEISFYTLDGEEVYSMEAFHYTGLTPSEEVDQ